MAIALTPATLSLPRGSTQTLTAKVTGSTNTGVTWRTSDETIARISPEGVLLGVSGGGATITAAAAADTSKTATMIVTVKAPAFRDSTVAALGRSPEVLAVAAHLSGHQMVVRRAAPPTTGQPITTWRDPDGQALTVWSDSSGRPERLVFGGMIAVFRNYRADTVDVALVTGDSVLVARDIEIPSLLYKQWQRLRTSTARGATTPGVAASVAAASGAAPSLQSTVGWGANAIGIASCVVSGAAILSGGAAPVAFWGPAAVCASTAVSTWNSFTGDQNGALTESIGAADLIAGFPECAISALACVAAMTSALAMDAQKAIELLTMKDPVLGTALLLLLPTPPQDVSVRIQKPCGCTAMDAGEARQYTPVVRGTSNTAVTWISSDPSVIEFVTPVSPTISGASGSALNLGFTAPNSGGALNMQAPKPGSTFGNPGVLVGRRPGVATITVRSVVDTTKTDTMTLRVWAVGAPRVGIAGRTDAQLAGSTRTLVGYVTGASTKGVTGWSSSDPKIATVSTTGLVTAVSEGTAWISVRSVEFPSLTAKHEVRVEDPRFVVQNVGTCGFQVHGLGQSATLAPNGRLSLPIRSEGAVAMKTLTAAGDCQYHVSLEGSSGWYLSASSYAISKSYESLELGKVAVYPVFYRGF